jgi:hypothetical protein
MVVWVPFLSPLMTHRYSNILTRLHMETSSSSSYIVTDGQSASSSGCRAPFGAHVQFLIFLCLIITFFDLHVGCPLWWGDGSVVCCADFNFLMFDNYFLRSSCKVPSLMRGWVCSLLCNHSLVRVTQNLLLYFTVSSETPSVWRARSLCLYPPGTGGPSYTPGHWVPFSSPLTTDSLQSLKRHVL